MHVLIVSPAYPPAPSGEAEHCFQIAARLAAQGHRVTVVAPQAAQRRDPQGFALDACVRGWRWRDLPRLAWTLRRHQPDAVLLIYTSWMYGGHPMVTFLATLVRRFRPGARFVTLFEFYSQPDVAPRGVRILRKLASWLAGRRAVDYCFGTLLRDSTGLIALGPSMVADFSRHGATVAARMVVVPPPPLLPERAPPDAAARRAIRQALGVGDGQLLLAYFGFVYPGKGIDTLLRAVQRLISEGRDVRVLMAGGGRSAAGVEGRHDRHEDEARALATALGIADRVVWPAGYGAGGGDDLVVGQLQSADLAVLPFDDGAELRRSSIAVVTAAGLPLLTTSPQSPTETAFEHGRNSWLTPPRDDQALAAAIGAVSDDRALRQRLAVGAAALAVQWFSWDTAIARISAELAATAPTA